MYVRKLLRRFFEQIDGEGSDLGGAEGVDNVPGEVGNPVPPDGGEAGADGGGDGAGEKEPGSMLEAINKGLEKIQQSTAKPGEKPAGDKAESGKKEEPKGDAKPKDEAKPPEGDPDLQTPEGLKEQAKERFEKIVGRLKTVTEQLETVTQERDEHVQTAQVFNRFIEDTGVTAEQFTLVGQYLQAVNKGDFEAATNIMLAELKSLQTLTGKAIDFGETADPLSDFPDLKDDVESYRITRERALELAAARAQRNAQQQRVQQTQQTQQQNEQAVAEWNTQKDSALAEIAKWSKTMRSSDLDFAVLEKVIAGQGALQQMMQTLPPERWLNGVQMLYNSAKAARASANPGAGSGSGTPRPMSGAGALPAGSTVAPKSMHEAMWGSAG